MQGDDYANDFDELNRDLGQLNFMEEPKDEAIVEDNDEDSFVDDDDVLELPPTKKQQLYIKERADEHKEFEDEIQCGPDVKLRERFRKYRHLASFIDNEWNKFVS